MVKSMEKNNSKLFKIVQYCSVLLLTTLVSCNVIQEDDRYIPIDLERSNRATLLVEFSGLQCVNCPTAAQEAHNLQGVYGDKLVVVEMHPASNPLTKVSDKKPEWNYTCEASDIYYKYFGGSATTPFPTGVINFAKDDDTFFVSHQLWGAACESSASKPSHIDLQQIVSLDTATRNIIIDAYITNLSITDMDVSYIAWLTEDSIIGPQQTEAGIDQQYAHNHILRDTVTDTWGTQIALKNGETSHQSITYTLPEKVVLENCNVVGIVMKDGEVVQVKEYKLKETI